MSWSVTNARHAHTHIHTPTHNTDTYITHTHTHTHTHAGGAGVSAKRADYFGNTPTLPETENAPGKADKQARVGFGIKVRDGAGD